MYTYLRYKYSRYCWLLFAVGCVQFSRTPELPAHSAAGGGGSRPADRAALRLGSRQDERGYEELQYAWLKQAAFIPQKQEKRRRKRTKYEAYYCLNPKSVWKNPLRHERVVNEREMQ